MQGPSGTLGGQLVFRQTSRGTVVSVAPQAPSGPPTAGQTAQRERFQQAVIYAKGQSQDPAVQPEYADEATRRKTSACITCYCATSCRRPASATWT
jgi:hypothetical protein